MSELEYFEELELPAQEAARVEEIQTAAFSFIQVLTENANVDLSMEIIGEVAYMTALMLMCHGIPVHCPVSMAGPDDNASGEDNHCV